MIACISGEKLPYLGSELELAVGGRGRIRKVGERLYLPEGTTPEQLAGWVKQQAKPYLTWHLESEAAKHGFAYASLRISHATGRWGSCSEDRRINLSWHLMLCPPECIRYVIIHELCHLLHMDHSRAFWYEVELRDPDFREHKRWLDEHGSFMDLL
ncbi:MAG: M48 family metallopeptidase [Lachnospiraceae bacterium]|nr:M48 family metallopeptidase [Lachnospiraceae bacterium]